MRLRNLTTGEIVARNVTRADTMWSRLMGLLLRDAVAPDEGMWFPACSMIHTVGMRVPLDVIFLGRGQRVLRVAAHVGRHRIAVGCRGTCSVIELGAGALCRTDVLIGDRLSLE